MARGRSGSNIPIEVRDFIRQAAVDFPNVNREKLAETIMEELTENGKRTPSLEHLKKMISAARNSATDEDRPWSLAASLKVGIPDEANGELLKIRKRCILAGREFTIREAKWVARLRTTMNNDNIVKVFPNAAKYASRERVWAMENENNPNVVFDTVEMDALMAFSDNYLSRETALLTGAISKTETMRQFIDTAKLIRSGITVDNVDVNAIASLRPGALQYVLSIGDFDEWREMKELSDEADEVYALWLRRMRESPNWPEPDSERRKHLADRLYEELLKVYTDYKNSLESIQQEIQKEYENSAEAAKELDFAKVRLIMSTAQWVPSKEILDEVGYEI